MSFSIKIDEANTQADMDIGLQQLSKEKDKVTTGHAETADDIALEERLLTDDGINSSEGEEDYDKTQMRV